MMRSDRVLMWMVVGAVVTLGAGAATIPLQAEVGGGIVPFGSGGVIQMPPDRLHIDCWPERGSGPIKCSPRSGRVDGAAGATSMVEGASCTILEPRHGQ